MATKTTLSGSSNSPTGWRSSSRQPVALDSGSSFRSGSPSVTASKLIANQRVSSVSLDPGLLFDIQLDGSVVLDHQFLPARFSGLLGTLRQPSFSYITTTLDPVVSGLSVSVLELFGSLWFSAFTLRTRNVHLFLESPIPLQRPLGGALQKVKEQGVSIYVAGPQGDPGKPNNSRGIQNETGRWQNWAREAQGGRP